MKKQKEFPTIKCSIVLDYMGSGEKTAEDEFTELEAHIKKKLLNPVRCYDVKMVHRIESGSGLVLFDFGGILPGNNLMTDQSRELIRWAENHPSALILVISEVTFTNFIQDEMESLSMTSLPNLQLWKIYDPLPDWPGLTAPKPTK